MTKINLYMLRLRARLFTDPSAAADRTAWFCTELVRWAPAGITNTDVRQPGQGLQHCVIAEKAAKATTETYSKSTRKYIYIKNTFSSQEIIRFFLKQQVRARVLKTFFSRFLAITFGNIVNSY